MLQGHIAIATALFPKGTRGSQLDSFARRALWEAGVDYAHGTGHGVGAFLSVHEGPQRISPAGSSQSGGDEPLQAGMILSNEPGYYKTGEYGIRIENLVLVVERQIEGAEKDMLGFETLTFAPIDRRLIEVSMLEPEELVWLNCYHAEVGRRSARSSTGRARLSRSRLRTALRDRNDEVGRAAGPLAWIALGWVLGPIYSRPRAALTAVSDHGYSLAAWVSSIF